MATTKGPSTFQRIIGVIGELLITCGLVIFLFIIWQVWWTDIGARAEQSRLVESFHSTVEVPDHVAEKKDYGDPLPMSHDGVKENEMWGVLHMPTIEEDFQAAIAEGVSLASVLDLGYVGHYPDTQLPGELGNVALAGHRQTYGAPFKKTPDLAEGDPIIIETKDAWYIYRVTGHEVVTPSAVEVIAPVPNDPGAEPTTSILTLTTCHPPFVSNERWITYAELDEWMPRSAGIPEELN